MGNHITSSSEHSAVDQSAQHIRAIIFDFGSVLDFDDNETQWLARRDKIASELGMSGEEMWSLFYKTDPWQQVKKGKIAYPEFWKLILTPLGIVENEAQKAFVDRLFEGRDHIHSEMNTIVRALKPHYKLAVLSNTFLPEMEQWLIDQHGFGGIFDVVVSSAKEGMAKPEPEIYQITLDRLGVEPHEALFIDDLPRNTLAAEALGINAIVFTTPAQLRVELAQRGILPQS
jgi:epoxide hydrolase-like predicted phosphatase